MQNMQPRMGTKVSYIRFLQNLLNSFQPANADCLFLGMLYNLNQPNIDHTQLSNMPFASVSSSSGGLQ